MPKKTKRDKVKADHRRKQHTLQIHTQEPLAPVSSAYTFKAVPNSHQRIAVARIDTSPITRDLAKTLVLTALAIATELIIYWQTRSIW